MSSATRACAPIASAPGSWKRTHQGLQDSPEILSDYLHCMPIARTGTVDDIGASVRFLCGPEASWITGVNLSVDGGQHLRRGPDWSSFARMAFGDASVDGPYDR